MGTAIFRTVFFYFFVTIGYRVMGKREVGQLGVVDLIVSLMIAELCAISIENIDDSIFLTIFPIIALIIIEVVLGYISVKSRKVRTILGGTSSLIISHGIINYKEMIKQRYCLDDLLLHLRQAEIKSIEDVEYAFLEANGKLSIFKYNCFKIPSSYPLPLIVEGIIQKNTLKDIKKNERWLLDYLNQKNITLNNVFYAFYKNFKVYIITHTEVGDKPNV